MSDESRRRVFEKILDGVHADLERETRRADIAQWSVFAGTDTVRVFGKPVRITVEWSEGLPNGFASAEEFQAFAAEQLAKLTGGES